MNLLSRRLILAALSLSLITLSLTFGPMSRAKVTGVELAPPELFVDSPQTSGASGFNVSNLDRSANACQDFNQFANGGWTAKNQIPPAYSRWGRFEVLGEQNLDALHEILDGLLKKKNHVAGSNEQKVADFYASCMDEQKIESEGLKPLADELERIDRITDLLSLQDEIARF